MFCEAQLTCTGWELALFADRLARLNFKEKTLSNVLVRDLNEDDRRIVRQTNKPGIEATHPNTNKHFAFLLEICHGFGPMLRRANMGRREHDERFLGKRRDRESIIQGCYCFAR